MSDFYNKYPYTDFHELNLDWVIERVKKLTEDWLATHEEWVGVQQDWADTEQAWIDFKAYVENYLANLDVQDEIDHKLDIMAADGTLDELLLPYFNEYKNDINTIIQNQNADIRTLEQRMDAFSTLTDGSTTGDAELMDIRVGFNGVTYPSAGDAVRAECDLVHNDIINSDLDIDIVNHGKTIIRPVTMTGGINEHTGVFDPNATNYVSTDFIKLPVNIGGIVTSFHSSSQYGGYAFYDKDYTYISGGQPNQTQGGGELITLLYTIPAGAYYFRISHSIASWPLTDLYIEFDVIDNYWFSRKFNTMINSMYDNIAVLSDGTVIYNPPLIEGNVDTSGTSHASSIHYKKTVPLPIPDGCYYIEHDFKSHSGTFGSAFYDENMTFISSNATDTRLINTITVIPSGARFIVINASMSNNTGTYVKMYFDNTATNVKNMAMAGTMQNHDAYVRWYANQLLNNDFDIIDQYGFYTTEKIYCGNAYAVEVINTISGSCRICGYDYNGNKIIKTSTSSSLDYLLEMNRSVAYFVVSCAANQISSINLKIINNRFEGKKLSIVGDSISSYAGSSVSGYDTYYPTGNVQSLSDLWWYQVAEHFKMTILSNASWSASSVCGDSQDPTGKIACSTQRISDLADNGTNPDVVFVYIGTNDWARSYNIGNYNSTMDVPGEGTIMQISNAYALMLSKIRTTYPHAELFILTELQGRHMSGDTTFPVLNDNSNSLHQVNHEIKEVAHIFGARVIDLEECKIDFWNINTYTVDGTIHPNRLGHRVIANSVINNMKNA